jgi:ribosomal protein L35AE/L33A
MAKAIFEDKKSLQHAKNKACGTVCYRKTKDGRVIAGKWPAKNVKKCLVKIEKTIPEKPSKA